MLTYKVWILQNSFVGSYCYATYRQCFSYIEALVNHTQN